MMLSALVLLACAAVGEEGELSPVELIKLAIPEAAAEKARPSLCVEGASRELLARLQRKVSFEFVDTPLREALNFLSEIGDVTVVLMPEASGSGDTPVSLRVEAMPLQHALGWVAYLAGLPARVEDEAVAVGSMRAAAPVLRIYDIRDLAPVADFPGPEIVLGEEGQAALVP